MKKCFENFLFPVPILAEKPTLPAHVWTGGQKAECLNVFRGTWQMLKFCNGTNMYDRYSCIWLDSSRTENASKSLNNSILYVEFRYTKWCRLANSNVKDVTSANNVDINKNIDKCSFRATKFCHATSCNGNSVRLEDFQVKTMFKQRENDNVFKELYA